MSGHKCVIVGISGPTNSGKSTISSMLCKTLPRTEQIRQDDYFLEPDDSSVEIKDGYQNWDTLSALHMDKMVAAVELWIRQQQNNTETAVLIVEGFLIYGHSELAALIDKKYFITITKEVCEDRRKYRVYNPPDTPGYFDTIVWPAYMEYKDDLKSQDDIEYIDGLTDVETLCQTMQCKIKNCIAKGTV
jgi:nicotinamide/nicotinate riboside kinase